jgi:hypothetical protein
VLARVADVLVMIVKACVLTWLRLRVAARGSIEYQEPLPTAKFRPVLEARFSVAVAHISPLARRAKTNETRAELDRTEASLKPY